MTERKLTIQVPKDLPPTRLDRFLATTDLDLSRSQIQQLIREKRIEIPGKGVKPAFILMGGETIHIEIPETERPRLTPENIPLNIIFEDEFLVVVDKPPGMVVHPARGHFTGTLVHALLGHCKSLPDCGGEMRPGVVHRLDKDTSGLIIFAKSELAHRRLAKALAERKIKREYVGIVWGKMPQIAGTIEGDIGHNPKDHKKMAVIEHGRPARTDYSTLKEFHFLSMVEFRLHTGRTHQIRVHASHVGHPIFGDPEYGGREERIGGIAPEFRRKAAELLKLIDRQALHARRLSFAHPMTSETIAVEAPLPNDIARLLVVFGG